MLKHYKNLQNFDGSQCQSNENLTYYLRTLASVLGSRQNLLVIGSTIPSLHVSNQLPSKSYHKGSLLVAERTEDYTGSQLHNASDLC